MPTFKQSVTPELIVRWIAQGKGRGIGGAYKPWLTVFDFSSRGLRTRLQGVSTGRIHHLFSRLELVFFHIADLDNGILDIREQYPLFPLTDTLALAKRRNIKHPIDQKTRHPIVMTTDFLLTISSGNDTRYEAWSVKYERDLLNKRTLQKLELERLYWQSIGVHWRIFTDASINPALVHSLRRLHPYKSRASIAFVPHDAVELITTYLRDRVQHGVVLAPIATACDKVLALRPGTSLQVARHLLANAYWPVDITKSTCPREPLTFRDCPFSLSQGVVDAAPCQ